jgi:hypothetical protein
VTPAAAATYRATFEPATSLTPVADAYVRNGAYAAQNFGTATAIHAKDAATIDNQRQGFLRFSIGTREVGRATLRLYGRTTAAGTVAIAVYPVASTTWSETGLTWNTRPARGSTALATRSITGTTNRWYEWDVTSYVRAERAAGRTSVNFALIGPARTNPYATFASREAAANQPELSIGDAPTTDPSNVVLYGTDAARFAGTWRMVADATAAGGSRINNPDQGVAKILTASGSPANYGEWTFNAEAGRGYRLWIRGKADRESHTNDSVHVQFSGSVTSSGTATFRIGSTSSTVYVLQDCASCTDRGWGWQDNGYGTGVLGDLIYFATTGPQTIRIQNREDGLSIDQIVLSPTTYFTTSPGATQNDTTIVPKP